MLISRYLPDAVVGVSLVSAKAVLGQSTVAGVEPLVQTVAQVGVFGGLVVWFVWHGAKRDAAREARIAAIEDRHASEMSATLKAVLEQQSANTAALHAMAAAMQQVAEAGQAVAKTVGKCAGSQA